MVCLTVDLDILSSREEGKSQSKMEKQVEERQNNLGGHRK